MSNIISRVFNSSLRDIIYNTAVFLIRSAIVAIPIGIAQTLSYSETNISGPFLGWTAAASVVVVILGYLNDYLNRRGFRGSSQQDEEVLFALLSTSLDSYSALHLNTPNISLFMSEVLGCIVKSVGVLLKVVGKEPGTISVNVMLVRTKLVNGRNEKMLVVKHKSNHVLSGTPEIHIPAVKKKAHMPGPDEAFGTGKIKYVPDTWVNNYRDVFDPSVDYRCYISIPLIIPGSRTVYGVLNIGSDQPNQFGSNKFVERNMMPKLKPFVLIIGLEQKSL